MKMFYFEGDRWLDEITSGDVSAAVAEVGASATPAMEPKDDHKACEPKRDSVSLPKHSYWFDLWVFLVFDIVLFLFVYFVVP